MHNGSLWVAYDAQYPVDDDHTHVCLASDACCIEDDDCVHHGVVLTSSSNWCHGHIVCI